MSCRSRFKEIDIANTVHSHFADIGQDESVLDVTFENGQARVRTLELMDTANRTGGLVVGTGDLSELALGWATYNGDHMSMYGVNAGVPKTLVRHLVRYEADIAATDALRTVLLDILDTPVSRSCCLPRTARSRRRPRTLWDPTSCTIFTCIRCCASALARQDLPAGKGWHLQAGRVPGHRAVQVAAQLLLAVLCPTVQAQLLARRPQGGQRDPFAPRRLADAQRCLCRTVAGRAGTIADQGLTHEKQKAADQSSVCRGRSGHCRCAAGGAPRARTGSRLRAELIYGDNNTTMNLPLDMDETYDVDTGYYTVHIQIKDGAARFVDSPCPDHICEGFGWLSNEDQTATCLPARAVLTIVPVS